MGHSGSVLSVLLFSWGLFSLSKTSVLSSSLPSRWTAQKGSEGASWTPLLGEWLGPLSLHPHPQHCQPPTPAKHQCTEREGLPPPLPAWDIEGSIAGWGAQTQTEGSCPHPHHFEVTSQLPVAMGYSARSGFSAGGKQSSREARGQLGLLQVCALPALLYRKAEQAAGIC